MEEKLKPCPFCGTDPRRTVKGQILSVQCPNCLVGFHNHASLGCYAEALWNERSYNSDCAKVLTQEEL